MAVKRKKTGVSIKITEGAIRGTFLEAVQEVSALKNFYTSFRDMLTKKQLKVEAEYKVGIAIYEFIESLLDEEDPEATYNIKKDTQIDGHNLSDIIDIRFVKTGNKVNVGYAMMPAFHKQDPQRARNQKYEIDSQREIFNRSILSNIVIIFERYLARIYEGLVVSNPESYFEGKTIKVKDLLSSSIEQIIFNEVEKQVSDNMYDSLKTLEMMKDKNGFNIDRYIPIQDELEEIYYRRNIFVHNSGRANDTYLSKVADKYKKQVKCNDPLICDDSYFENALEVLKKVICILFYEFLLAIKAPCSEYEPIHQNVAFTALANGEYAFCEYIYDVLQRHKEFEFADKTMYQINRMIAMKQQGKPVAHLLNKFDVSAMQEQFVIAKYCLLDDHEKVYKLLTKAYPNSMTADAIRDWPLFLDFRKSEQYNKFKSEHADDFEQYIFELDETQTLCETSEAVCSEAGSGN